jgi:hypothetical protein
MDTTLTLARPTIARALQLKPSTRKVLAALFQGPLRQRLRSRQSIKELRRAGYLIERERGAYVLGDMYWS